MPKGTGLGTIFINSLREKKKKITNFFDNFYSFRESSIKTFFKLSIKK